MNEHGAPTLVLCFCGSSLVVLFSTNQIHAISYDTLWGFHIRFYIRSAPAAHVMRDWRHLDKKTIPLIFSSTPLQTLSDLNTAAFYQQTVSHLGTPFSLRIRFLPLTFYTTMDISFD